GLRDDALVQPLAFNRWNQLRVRYPWYVTVRMKDHGGRHDWSGQTAASNLIDACHMHEPDAPQRVLERAHGGDAHEELSAVCSERSALTVRLRRAFRRRMPAGRLPLEVPQIVQLGTANLRGARHLDLLDRRRVQWKDPFDTLSERHFADCERSARPTPMQPDDDPLENLDPLLVAFAHLHV